MRILQIVHSLPFLNQAGTEIYTYDLSRELSKRHEVYIFSRTCNIKQREYEITKKNIDRITVYFINNTFKQCNSFEMYYENDAIDRRFAELINEIKPDIIHIQHIVFLSIGLIKIIKDRGIPIIFTLHDYWLMCPKWHLLKRDYRPCNKAEIEQFDKECLSCISELIYIKKGAKRFYVFSKQFMSRFVLEKFKKMYFLFMKKTSSSNNTIIKLKERNRKIKDFLSKVDLFLVPSEYSKDKFIKFGIPPEKIRLSRNGLNGRLSRDLQKTKTGKIRFGFIGTILPAKGLHVLIKAFNGIKDRDIELKIYGRLYSYIGFEDYLPSLKKIIKDKNIRFMGEFNYQNSVDIFKEIDVLIVPSIWHENSPLVIHEAFLSKTPVIASRIGGIPELVTDGENGLLFNPGDKKGLQEKIEYIINNPERIGIFKENIPVIRHIEDNAKEIEALYSNLITKKKPSTVNYNTLQ